MMKRILMPLVALAAAALAMPFSALAQSKQGYWTEPAGGDIVWRSGTGLCWRAGYWTPAMAIAECDPDLVPKPAAPAAPVAPPPPPPPPPKAEPKPAPKPVAEKVTLAADVLFDFDK